MPTYPPSPELDDEDPVRRRQEHVRLHSDELREAHARLALEIAELSVGTDSTMIVVLSQALGSASMKAGELATAARGTDADVIQLERSYQREMRRMATSRSTVPDEQSLVAVEAQLRDVEAAIGEADTAKEHLDALRRQLLDRVSALRAEGHHTAEAAS